MIRYRESKSGETREVKFSPPPRGLCKALMALPRGPYQERLINGMEPWVPHRGLGTADPTPERAELVRLFHETAETFQWSARIVLIKQGNVWKGQMVLFDADGNGAIW